MVSDCLDCLNSAGGTDSITTSRNEEKEMRASRNLIPAAALAAACVHAQAAQVQLYGIVDAGIESTSSSAGRQWRALSGGLYGSRWGVTGSEDLGAGRRAVFRLESGFAADDGSFLQGGRAFGRESSVGVASDALGTLLIGRLPTPYYLSQSAVDAFAWGNAGSLAAATRSEKGVTRQLLPTAVSGRADNAIAYVTPAWGGFSARVLYSLGEGSTALGRSQGAAVRYVTHRGTAIAAWNKQFAGAGAGGGVTAFTAGGSVELAPVRLYAGFTQERNSCTTCTGAFARNQGVSGVSPSEFRLLNLGVRVPSGAAVLIAQATRIQDRSSYAVSTGGRGAWWWAAGLEYTLSRRTIAYASIGSIGNRNGSSYALGTGSAQQGAGYLPDPSRVTTIAAGLRHSF
jgi:predicted porin